MDYAELKERTIEYAKSIGIAKIGFADAKPLTEYLKFLAARQNAGYKYAIKEGDPQRRIDPSKHLPGAEAVISIAVPYPSEVYSHVGPTSPEHSPRGRISIVSRGRDYHDEVMDKLKHLQKFLEAQLPGARVVAMVDKEELLEKALAVKAGLGWIGKNTLLVTPEFGSLVCLGELITDIPFPADEPLPPLCRECNQCVKACPTKAIVSAHCLNPDRCLAGVSQFKGNIDHALREAMGVSIYGCDICQLACPYNRKIIEAYINERSGEAKNKPSFEDAHPLLVDLLEISNRGFRERFGHTSGAWRGRSVFQRNAILAAGNLKSNGLVPVLARRLLEDVRPVIRSAAAWALGQIGDKESLRILKKALNTEKQAEVLSEIELALRDSTKTTPPF